MKIFDRRQVNKEAFFSPLTMAIALVFLQTNLVSLPVHAASSHTKKAVPVVGSTPAVALDSASLIKIIQSAHILAPEYPINAGLDNNEALILTVRHPNATDQDCKIDAVLVAKSIMDAYPKQIIRVKLLLSDARSENMHEVAVTAGDVRAYATGTISKDELLSSLEITRVSNSHTEKAATVSLNNDNGPVNVPPGVYKYERQMLTGRIEYLKARGTGTKPFEEMMDKIEADIKQGPGAVPIQNIQEALKDLNTRLNEQEQAVQQAQDIASGKKNAHFGKNRPFAGNGDRETRFNAIRARYNQAQGQSNAGGTGNQPDDGAAAKNKGIAGRILLRIREMQSQGQDVSAARNTLGEIRRLRQSGQTDQANTLANTLAKSLGINP
ncbi:MAG: hypothetical protein KGS72_08145 [Cyanobacteria bacterium REEB67]|nr:hypothetical protein [Cyanobacteria bacterium REEB67]